MIVADASVVASAIADDGEDGRVARARLAAGGRIVAPELLDVEVASVLRRRALAGALSDERLTAAIGDLAAAPITRVPMRSLIARSLELRDNVTPYDGVYVALAEDLDCELVTADRRLSTAPGVRCRIELLVSGRGGR